MGRGVIVVAAKGAAGRRLRAADAIGLVVAAGAPVVIAVVFLIGRQEAGVRPGFPLDDSWIHLRFADNLARGRGFSFNPGVPSTGATAPLWVVILAAGTRLLGSVQTAALVLGAALTAGACLLVYGVALTLLARRDFAVAAAVLTALTGPLPWLSVSGMEPPLYIALTMLGIYLHVSTRSRQGPMRYAAPAVFGLAAMARPECALLLVFALVDRWALALWARSPRVKALMGETALAVVVFLVVISPAIVFNLMVSGRPFPNTFYAKTTGFGLFALLRGDAETGALGRMVTTIPLRWVVNALETAAENNVVILLFFGAGLLEVVRLAGQRDSGHPSLMLPVVFVGMPLFMGLLLPLAPPDFQGQRYSANVVPPFVLVGVLGAYRLAGLTAGAQSATKARHGAVAALLVLALAPPLIALPGRVETYRAAVDNVNRMHVDVGYWLRANTPSDALVAAEDVGAIGFFSDRRIFDLHGLISPEAIPYKWSDRDKLTLLARVQPDYLVIPPAGRPLFEQHAEVFVPVYEVRLYRNVVAIGDRMVVYQTPWTRHRDALPGEATP